MCSQRQTSHQQTLFISFAFLPVEKFSERTYQYSLHNKSLNSYEAAVAPQLLASFILKSGGCRGLEEPRERQQEVRKSKREDPGERQQENIVRLECRSSKLNCFIPCNEI